MSFLEYMTIDFSNIELLKLAKEYKKKYSRNWFQRYIRFLGIIPIVNSGREDEIIDILEQLDNDRIKTWRFKKLLEDYK